MSAAEETRCPMCHDTKAVYPHGSADKRPCPQCDRRSSGLAQARTLAVLDEVAAERVRQTAKWGEQNHDPVGWSAILSEENGEVAKEVTHLLPPATGFDGAAYRTELIQTAAVAVQAVECFDRLSQVREAGSEA